MCAIDWSLMGMKQYLYAIQQHSEKRIDIPVRLLLILSTYSLYIEIVIISVFNFPYGTI